MATTSTTYGKLSLAQSVDAANRITAPQHFLTLPYGKFAHGVFRSAALLKWAIEKRSPSNVKLSED